MFKKEDTKQFLGTKLNNFLAPKFSGQDFKNEVSQDQPL